MDKQTLEDFASPTDNSSYRPNKPYLIQKMRAIKYTNFFQKLYK